MDLIVLFFRKGRDGMNIEHSCGAVIFNREKKQLRYVLICQRGGFYGFPKGHMEQGETERETAVREIFEEVHLRPTFVEGFVAHDRYPLPSKQNTIKKVTFFLAEYENQPIVIQPEELLSARLASYEEALKLLRHESSRRVLRKAHQFLMAHGISDAQA